MIKIQSLLNPSASSNSFRITTSISPPPTPAYTVQDSSASSTPVPQTPSTPPPNAKRQKLTKDAPVFVKGQVKGTVGYPPHECTEIHDNLSPSERASLVEQHQRFQIYPCGRGQAGCIGDYVRHIPYSSEKKTFFANTGRDAFDGKSASYIYFQRC